MRPSAITHAPVQRPRPQGEVTTTDTLLTVEQAAERLGTGVRFIRRLIQERRIRYVKLGKPVRIPESAIAAYIEERAVPTLGDTRSRFGKAA